MKIRCFLAIPLDETTLVELSSLADRLSELDRRRLVRWLTLENYHLTLAFLGEIDPDQIPGLILALERKLGMFASGCMRITELSPFPFNPQPKVIAALAETSDWLKSLHERVCHAVRNCGIPLERRRFEPHVTVGRVQRKKRGLLNIPPLAASLEMPVREVTLFQSELTRHGALYSALETVELNPQV